MIGRLGALSDAEVNALGAAVVVVLCRLSPSGRWAFGALSLGLAFALGRGVVVPQDLLVWPVVEATGLGWPVLGAVVLAAALGGPPRWDSVAGRGAASVVAMLLGGMALGAQVVAGWASPRTRGWQLAGLASVLLAAVAGTVDVVVQSGAGSGVLAAGLSGVLLGALGGEVAGPLLALCVASALGPAGAVLVPAAVLAALPSVLWRRRSAISTKTPSRSPT